VLPEQFQSLGAEGTYIDNMDARYLPILSRINGGTMTQTSIGIQEVGVPGTYHDMAEWMIIGEFSDMVGHDDLFLQFNHVLSLSSGSWSRLIRIHDGQSGDGCNWRHRSIADLYSPSADRVELEAHWQRALHKIFLFVWIEHPINISPIMDIDQFDLH
jgi:hypothetical protein